MMYTRSQNYTIVVVGIHGIQHIRSCGCCVVVFVVVTSLLFLDKWFVK